MQDIDITLSFSSILYGAILLTAPIWGKKSYKKVKGIFGYIFLSSIPLSLVYSLSRELYSKDQTTLTMLLPVLPIVLLMNNQFFNYMSNLNLGK